jgi:glutathione S-transferase
MKIHDFPPSPNAFRIRVVLAEKGLSNQVTFIPVDLPAAEHKKPPFLAINPVGTTPVLELDDGTYLAECTAITEYLDNLDGHPTLTGITPLEKGTIHMMQKRAESELLDAVGYHFHYATPGLGRLLEVYKSPNWSARTEWGNQQRDRAIAGMRYFNQVLKTRPYVAGENFSMADITVLAGLMFATFAPIPVPAECTTLIAWAEKMHTRPSVHHPA